MKETEQINCCPPKIDIEPENLKHIRDRIAALDAGLGVEHDIKDI